MRICIFRRLWTLDVSWRTSFLGTYKCAEKWRPSTYVQHSPFDIQHSLNVYSGAKLSNIANSKYMSFQYNRTPCFNFRYPQTIAKPARLETIWKCSYSIQRKDYWKFIISLPKHSSPGTIHLTDYKWRHTSASGRLPRKPSPNRYGLNLYDHFKFICMPIFNQFRNMKTYK